MSKVETIERKLNTLKQAMIDIQKNVSLERKMGHMMSAQLMAAKHGADLEKILETSLKQPSEIESLRRGFDELRDRIVRLERMLTKLEVETDEESEGEPESEEDQAVKALTKKCRVIVKRLRWEE